MPEETGAGKFPGRPLDNFPSAQPFRFRVTSAKRYHCMEAVGDADRLCGSPHPERRAIYPCNRIRENETDNGLEAAAIIPRSRCPHRGGLRWLATRTQSRLCGGLLEEFLRCSARKSRAVAFSQRSFGASWKPFECAQRICEPSPSARRDRRSSANRSARNAFEHLRVGRELFHKH